MKRVIGLLLAAGALGAAACEEIVPRERKLSSFEVKLVSPIGTREHRCVLPGTPTTGLSLDGCPRYEKDAQGNTVARVDFEARAIDDQGELLDTYDQLAEVRVVPGKVEAAFDTVRFQGGLVQRAVSFRGSFSDTYLWIVDNKSPPRSAEVSNLGISCGFEKKDVCSPFGLTCVNSTPEVGFDPQGLAYCTKGCSGDSECPEGYFCGDEIDVYEDAAADVSDGACLRRQPTYAAGVGGPIHLVDPTLSDISRSESLVSSPFQDNFVVVVERGRMVVTNVRIDGFYVTDICPGGRNAPTTDTDAACPPQARQSIPEFNHLFVFNFSRPDDLFAGDRLISVSGPMSEFVGLTEMNFPLWDVNIEASQDCARAPDPTICPVVPIDLHAKVQDVYPHLLEVGAPCYRTDIPLDSIVMLECAMAMERIEAARVKVRIREISVIQRGSREEMNYDKFGQWPVKVEIPPGRRMGYEGPNFVMLTRENLPFFDPKLLGGQVMTREVVGNLRQVAFDDRDDNVLWILEPRDQADCPWCVNP